jgi:K+-sensing histidine kinase KdpD
MLKRMIRNVVDNAVRYANRELTFLASHYDGDEAVVMVADDGDGIDVSQSERVSSNGSSARTRAQRARRAAPASASPSSPRSWRATGDRSTSRRSNAAP